MDSDKERCQGKMESRGFPGCFASWDCKHFRWNACPVRLAGQHLGKFVCLFLFLFSTIISYNYFILFYFIFLFSGKDRIKSLILEAICDSDTYIWYHFFGEPGSLNDINILDRSSIVGAIFGQTFNSQVVPYIINGTTRDYMYFLVDGIYPLWSIFPKTNPNPVTEDEKYYKRRHEHVRKDIERAFGILVKKFEILDKGFRVFDLQEIKNILSVCIILHNMTVKV